MASAASQAMCASLLLASSALLAQTTPRIEPQFPLEEEAPEPPPYDADSDPEALGQPMLCFSEPGRCPAPDRKSVV